MPKNELMPSVHYEKKRYIHRLDLVVKQIDGAGQDARRARMAQDAPSSAKALKATNRSVNDHTSGGRRMRPGEDGPWRDLPQTHTSQQEATERQAPAGV